MAKRLEKNTQISLIRRRLHQWFLKKKRSFPWREKKTPYRVWISEIMLQQTRSEVVVAYFNRWMRLFPSIESLAKAPLDQILKTWEGLGYYQRARNIHQAAHIIVEKYQGVFPQGEKLKDLPGVGRYTYGAITLFGWEKRAVAIDANVFRVMIRFLGIREEGSRSVAYDKAEKFLETFLCAKRPWLTNEALIELGALMCITSQPFCSLCPLRLVCYAFIHDCVVDYPKKKNPKKVYFLKRAVAVVLHKNKLLVLQNKQGLFADLYQFPYIDLDNTGQENPEKVLQKRFPFLFLQPLRVVEHSFTQYRVTLVPFLFETKEERILHDYKWEEIERLRHLPFCSGHRQIFHQIDEELSLLF
ncbi:MAG: A/G-specific adenine glycosylase [Parachlamydiales bacterium]|nr:A/G-specific adenine glycosylase [Parachlamydiales bacterium]